MLRVYTGREGPVEGGGELHPASDTLPRSLASSVVLPRPAAAALARPHSISRPNRGRWGFTKGRQKTLERAGPASQGETLTRSAQGGPSPAGK